jgi:hypothetical protein
MVLSTSQLIILKNWIIANNNSIFDQIAADLLNALSIPDFIVWKTSVTRKEILENVFDWTRLDNLSVGKARIWSDIFVDNNINPSKENVRLGINAVWVGTSADLAVREGVYVHCKRKATVAERLLAVGTGTDASPATLNFEGNLTVDDIINVANS